MKRHFLVPILFLATAAFAGAQIQNPTSDVLGAHLNHGRGCAACHAPHSGAYGNGNAKTADSTAGNSILWGQDVASLYGQVITSAGGRVETLPSSMAATTPDVTGMLTCLSCHDGNYATGAMMLNKVYESLPSTYGNFQKPPTLLGFDGTTAGNYLNDHPVGLSASIGCGGSHNWDCTISASGAIQVNGPNMAAFVQNYGFFVSPGTYNNQPVVVCTTCHNQHLMNVVSVTNDGGTLASGAAVKGKSGLPAGNYATMFFVRAPYNPADANTTTNQTAQFCRECHGGEANEMNGGLGIPTVF